MLNDSNNIFFETYWMQQNACFNYSMGLLLGKIWINFFFIAHVPYATKTYYKTKDYCKVKFSYQLEKAEVVEILGLNTDWENAIIMSKKKDGTFLCRCKPSKRFNLWV